MAAWNSVLRLSGSKIVFLVRKCAEEVLNLSGPFISSGPLPVPPEHMFYRQQGYFASIFPGVTNWEQSLEQILQLSTSQHSCIIYTQCNMGELGSCKYKQHIWHLPVEEAPWGASSVPSLMGQPEELFLNAWQLHMKIPVPWHGR